MLNASKKSTIIDIYIGRQPIYDRDLNVVAYELLYRSSDSCNQAENSDGEMMTTQVLINAFMEIGFDNLVGEKKAFINMPRGFLLGEYTLSLPNDRVILEVLEDIVIDDEVIFSVQNLANQGYKIALDDFVYHKSLKPLIDIANIIKIDLTKLSFYEIEKHVAILKKDYDVKLLAEKVETKKDFDFCKQLDFEYYQGYFFSRPQIIKATKMPTNRLAVLRLIAEINEPEITYKKLEISISKDVLLSYKLLRVINSAANFSSQKIESMNHALTILGLKNIRNWVTMIVLAGVNEKSNELMKCAMIRAKMCELLAKLVNARYVDTYFTVGLFSNLDALMDQPLVDLLTPLPLTIEIKQALLDQSGNMGKILACAIAYEKGDWSNVVIDDVDPTQIKQAYFDALYWSREVDRELTGC